MGTYPCSPIGICLMKVNRVGPEGSLSSQRSKQVVQSQVHCPESLPIISASHFKTFSGDYTCDTELPYDLRFLLHNSELYLLVDYYTSNHLSNHIGNHVGNHISNQSWLINLLTIYSLVKLPFPWRKSLYSIHTVDDSIKSCRRWYSLKLPSVMWIAMNRLDFINPPLFSVGALHRFAHLGGI